jgi:3-dehydroquinate dehydratase
VGLCAGRGEVPITCKIILSSHNFKETPPAEVLQQLARDMHAAGQWGPRCCVPTQQWVLQQLSAAAGMNAIPLLVLCLVDMYKLRFVYTLLLSTGADIVKIATMANDITDCAAVLSLLQAPVGEWSCQQA